MRVYVCFDDDYDDDHHIGCFKTLLLLYGAQCVNLFTFFSNEFFKEPVHEYQYRKEFLI